MIGEKAGRALTLLEGIKTLKEGGDAPELWHGITARFIVDLDAAGDQAGLAVLVTLLADLWNRVPGNGDAREAPKVTSTGNDVADVVTSQLARALAASGMSDANAVRSAERIRRVYQRAFTADGTRQATTRPAPVQQYENACARFSEAAASVNRVRKATLRLTADAEREYAEAQALLATFEKSPGVPKDEYREAVAGDGGGDRD